MSTAQALLRLHIEACWGIHVPPITQNTIELLLTGVQPPWKLYIADMADGQFSIWRSDVSESERPVLFRQAREALAIPPTAQAAPQIDREVALHQTEAPIMSIAEAQHMARMLTPD